MNAFAKRIDRLPLLAWIGMGLLAGVATGAVLRVAKLVGALL